jgi:hypothetical protein
MLAVGVPTITITAIGVERLVMWHSIVMGKSEIGGGGSISYRVPGLRALEIVFVRLELSDMAIANIGRE